MRENQRPRILDAGLRVAGTLEGAAITLDKVAREAGVSKPGLMYHFPTRDALMSGLVEHAALQVIQRMSRFLATEPQKASLTERYAAYIKTAAEGQNARAEWALWSHSAYIPQLQEAWKRHLGPMLDLPPETPHEQRIRLNTARLAAEGLWAAQASGVLAPNEGDRKAVVAHLLALTQGSGLT
ncbi:TetR/AcrR family transcriptional regulator [Paenarthrobacter nicotinovorans]|uniref:TetR/AcrR family transcriptional regulator n=1 Tax=Paenarthrobacter TaxID=1742992 RepID=UPI00382F4531